MARFRLKPAEVDAVQWLQPGDHPAVQPYSPKGITAMLFPAGTHLLYTGKGALPANPGDWIVTAADGSLSVYRPDAFAAAFEPLTEDGSPDPDAFYLQDSRTYVGNDMLFWAIGGGYTTDIRKAEVFSRERAQSQHDDRETDIPWPKAYIDARTRPAVDMQYVNRTEALDLTGIVLRKPERRKSKPDRCYGCGQFLKTDSRYLYDCPSCGADNRP